eukprot:1181959-Prorocentrum_minimum.AAC.3
MAQKGDERTVPCPPCQKLPASRMGYRSGNEHEGRSDGFRLECLGFAAHKYSNVPFKLVEQLPNASLAARGGRNQPRVLFDTKTKLMSKLTHQHAHTTHLKRA